MACPKLNITEFFIFYENKNIDLNLYAMTFNNPILWWDEFGLKTRLNKKEKKFEMKIKKPNKGIKSRLTSPYKEFPQDILNAMNQAWTDLFSQLYGALNRWEDDYLMEILLCQAVNAYYAKKTLSQIDGISNTKENIKITVRHYWSIVINVVLIN